MPVSAPFKCDPSPSLESFLLSAVDVDYHLGNVAIVLSGSTDMKRARVILEQKRPKGSISDYHGDLHPVVKRLKQDQHGSQTTTRFLLITEALFTNSRWTKQIVRLQRVVDQLKLHRMELACAPEGLGWCWIQRLFEVTEQERLHRKRLTTVTEYFPDKTVYTLDDTNLQREDFLHRKFALSLADIKAHCPTGSGRNADMFFGFPGNTTRGKGNGQGRDRGSDSLGVNQLPLCMLLSTIVTSSELQSHERVSLVALVCASELTSRLGKLFRQMPGRQDDHRGSPPELCRNYLKGRCDHGDTCHRLHDAGDDSKYDHEEKKGNKEKKGENEEEKADRLQNKVIVNTLLTLSLSLCGGHSFEIGLVYALGNGLSSDKLLPGITLQNDLRTDFDQKLEFLLKELGARIKRKCAQLDSWLQHKSIPSAWSRTLLKAQAEQDTFGRLRVTKVFLESQVLSAVKAAHACNGGFIAGVSVKPCSEDGKGPLERAARKAVFGGKKLVFGGPRQSSGSANAAVGEQIVCRLLELEYRHGQDKAEEAWKSINALQRECSFKLNDPPPHVASACPAAGGEVQLKIEEDNVWLFSGQQAKAQADLGRVFALRRHVVQLGSRKVMAVLQCTLFNDDATNVVKFDADDDHNGTRYNKPEDDERKADGKDDERCRNFAKLKIRRRRPVKMLQEDCNLFARGECRMGDRCRRQHVS